MADGSFRIAGAFVEVNLKDNTQADEAKLRARLEKSGPVDFETALKDPDNVRVVKERITAGPAVKIRTDADTALAQAKIKELSARRNASIISLDADVSKAQARITDLESKRGKTKLDVDAEIGKAQAKIEALQAKKSRILVEIDVDKAAVAKAAREVDSETEKMAARANAKFSALGFGAAFAGLPAAAAVAGAGVAAGLSAAPLAFAALAAAALKNNAQVTASFSALKTRVVGDTQEMAGVLAGPLSTAANDLGASFTRLRPQIQTAMTGSVPAVHTLTGAVTDFAEGAMPGLVAAVQASNAPLQGLRSLAGQTGSGLALMLTNMARGADGAGQSLNQLGGIVHDAEGFLGTLFANLATNGGPVLAQFRGALSQVEGVLANLTSNGMPALTGAFSGFMGQVQGALGILNAVSGALGGWAGPIANIAGALKALDMMTFGKASGALKGLYTEMKNAEAGSATFGTGLTSTATRASAFGGALAVLGVALKVIGDRSQEASTLLSEHKDAVSILTNAYRQSDGVLTDSVKAALQTDQTFQKLSTSAKSLGINQQQLTTDVASGAGAFSDSANQIRGVASALIDSAHPFGTFGQTMRADVDHMIQFGGTAEQVSGNIDTLVAAYEKSHNASDAESAAYRDKITTLVNAAGQYNSLSGAAKEAAAGQKLYQAYLDTIPASSRAANAASAELATSFNKIRDAATTAADKGSALVLVMDRLSGRAPTYEESTQALNDGLRTLGDSFDAASTTSGKFDNSLLNADGTVNTVTKNGSALQDKMIALEKSMSDTSGSIGDMVKAGTPLPVALQKINDQAETAHDRFIKQAEAMGFSKTQSEKLAGAYHIGNDALGQYISTLTDADLKAAGITKTVDKFGDTIIHLPNGKDINIGADTTSALANVKRFKDVADATTAETTVGANIDPATKKVLDWKNTTFQTIGNTTTYTNTDPATGQVRNWKVTTDQTGAQTTTYSTTNPATGQVDTFIRDTNGKWSTVNVGANTAPAQTALQRFYDSYIHSVTVDVHARVAGPGVGLLQGANIVGGGAHGGITIPGFAEGGITTYAAGGLRDLVPMSSLASMVPPNSWRVIGDNQRVPEAYIPVDPGSRRSQDLLSETNALMGRGASAGTTITNHVTINGADTPTPQLASAVGAELSWRLRAM